MQPGNINNHELDDLLKTSFLELDANSEENSELMDKVSASVFAREWPESQLKESKAPSSKVLISKGPWIWYLSACLLVLGLSYGAWAYYKHEGSEATSASAKGEVPSANNLPAAASIQPDNVAAAGDMTALSDKASENNTGSKSIQSELEPAHNIVVYMPGNKQATGSEASDNNLVASAVSYSVSTGTQVTDTLPYPSPGSTDSIMGTQGEVAAQFTEKEKQEHDKNIQQMLDNIAGLRFQDYSKISVEDKNLNINTEFFLKRGEVTNKQYKLFLNDLLIHGKKIEYEIARPKPELIWTDAKDRNNKNFLVQYLKKSSYDDYPVVCISPEGMEMYCQWLKQEIEGYYKRNGRTVSLSVRLPYDTEWKYAASEGKRNHRYGTEKGKIRSKGIYLANFSEAQRKFVAEKDTVLAVDLKKKKESKDVPVTHRLSKNIFTAKEGDYPSYFNLSNMSGNVSEVVMVKGDKGNTLRTIGGNWNSQKAFLKINAPDEFGGKVYASPYIGFRPVIMINN